VVAETGDGTTRSRSSWGYRNPLLEPRLAIRSQSLLGYRSGSVTWDPPSIAAAAQTTTTVTVTGAALGDPCFVGFSLDLQAMQLTGYVSSAGVVTVVPQNGTAGAIDLASGTLRATVLKHTT